MNKWASDDWWCCSCSPLQVCCSALNWSGQMARRRSSRSDPSVLIDTRADRIALSSCFARPMVYGGPMVPGRGDMQNISQQWIVHIRAAISAASTLQFCTFIAIQILKSWIFRVWFKICVVKWVDITYMHRYCENHECGVQIDHDDLVKGKYDETWF